MHKNIEKRVAVCYNCSMQKVAVRSYAKINLSLDITGARGGYHSIDSVVASINICDEITAAPRSDGRVCIAMCGMGSEDIPPEKNNAVKAAERFIGRFGTCGADIAIKKNIPVGAGLGGSSADVAGVLNALAKLYGVTDGEGLKAIADELGSDCGYMLRGGFARMTGRGERVCPINFGGRFYLILLLPGEGVSTARCYALSDVYPEKRHTSAAVHSAICGGQPQKVGALLSNGLYPAAVVINPSVREAFDGLLSLGADGVNMTGSGSGVYALFCDRDARDSALKKYGGAFPAVAAHTLVPEEE